MLTILKTDDKTEIKSFCEESNIKYNDGIHAFVAKNRDELIGYILYCFTEYNCEIVAVEPYGDEPLFDGLIRSVFFSVTENGVDLQAVFSKSIDKNLLIKYRFIDDDTYSVKSMSDFLNNCKNCKNIQ